jgi:gliding motility-associated-like protein
VKRIIPCILLCLAALLCQAQSPAIKKEGGKFFSDTFVHEASELYDWHQVENALAEKTGSTPARCNDFFNFIFRSGEVSMHEYLLLVEQKKIDKSNALQYWLGKLPLFEKLYREKYVPLTAPAMMAKHGNSSVQTGGANCNNLDFYTGTTTGWSGQWNNANNVPGSNAYGGLTANGFHNSLYDRWGYAHELCTGGFDRNVPISCVPPGHSYAMRLGNDSAYQLLQTYGNNPPYLPYNHQIISNTFLVTQQNKSVSYWYAVVLCQYNPNNHPSTIQPYFKIRMYDAAGNEIMCAHYDVDALTAPSIGGFQIVNDGITDPNTGSFTPYDFFYKPWSQVMIPLNNYVGQNVTITFETSDCAGGGHPGYAYVAVDCAPMPNIQITPFACGGAGATASLTAPAGAATYSWAGPGIVGSSTSQTVTVNTAGSYTVTMTTLGNSGFNCTFSVDTTIGPPPPPPVASFTFAPGCINTPIQFTDQSTTSGGDPIVGWNWTFGDGTGSTSYNPSHVYTSSTAGSFPVNYTITTAYGCSATYSATVTTYPPPLPSATANTVCAGSATQFNNTSISSVSYSWNFGDGSPASILSSPSHTYPAAGNYTATLTGTTVNGCNGTFSVAVLVKPKPVASFSAATACLGSPSNFANTSSNVVGASYTWNFGDNSTLADTSHLQNPSYTYPGSGTFTVSLAVAGTGGCNDNTTYTVQVSPLPSVSVSSPLPFCPGTTVPSPVLTSTPSTGVSYSWSNSNTQIGLGAGGTGIPPSFVAGQNTSNGNLTGVITITPYLNGCAGPPATQTISIQTAPIVVQPAVELCPNLQSNTLNFTTIPAGIPANFNWTNTTPGNFIGLSPVSGTGSIPSFTTIDPGSNSLSILISVYASYNGCNGPPSSFSITANPYPYADFSNSPACEGNNTQFNDASTVNGSSVVQWGWDMNNDGNFNDASLQAPVYVFPSPGPHIVNLEVTSGKGCKDQVSHTVFVNASPKVDFYGDVLSGCSIHTVSFMDSTSVAPPQKIVAYNWYFGNGLAWHSPGPAASSFVNTAHNANAYYTISLQVVSDSGCIGSVQKTDYITVYPIPLAAFSWGPQDADLFDPLIQFTDQSIGASGSIPWLYYLGDTFLANDSDNYTTDRNPVHKYSDLQEGIYTVTQWVENQYGCRDSASQNVVIKSVFTFYAPNAFTPGFNGLNDGFKGTGFGIDNSTYRMLIYDRWGQLLFESHDLEQEWDGKVHGEPAQQDTYVWKVTFDDVTGTFHEYKGVVNLLR